MLYYYHNFFIYSFYLPNFKTQLNFNKNNSFFTLNYFIQKSQYFYLNKITQNDIHFSTSQFIDISAYATNSKVVIFYVKFNFATFTTINYFCKTWELISQTILFKNLFFLERELQEMFGIKILKNKDTRNLLLDYTIFINPLNPNYPVEGYNEIFLNIFEDKIEYIQSNYIEL